MRSLVVGFGSIGARHAKILAELGCDVSVVSSRPVDWSPCFTSLEKAFEYAVPGYVVVANRTHHHYETLANLAKMGYQGLLLVEKPLYDTHNKPLFQYPFSDCFVGYNLRFHPVIQKLAHALNGEKIISAQVYAGQYLPSWRPGRDYRTAYSTNQAQGGGVLRDLSHELDLVQWLLGDWRKIVSLMGHHSHLEIDSEDVVAVMMSTEHCPVVTVQLNYLDRFTHRDITINTDAHTFRADLIEGTLRTDGVKEVLTAERDETYRAQHQAVLAKDRSTLCTFSEGLAIVELIDAVEKSFAAEGWVRRC